MFKCHFVLQNRTLLEHIVAMFETVSVGDVASVPGLLALNISRFGRGGRGFGSLDAFIQLFQLTLSDFKASSLRDKTES